MTDVPTADLDEFLAGEYDEPAAGLTVCDDGMAAWAFRKLRGYQDERARLQAQADTERARIDVWLGDVTSGLDREIDKFEQALVGFYRELLDKEPDTAKTYRVLGGEIQRRKNPDRIEVVDEAAAVEWASLVYPEILTQPTVSKQSVKGNVGRGLSVVDGVLVTDDGEVVPGVVLVVGDERIAAKVTR